MYRHLTDFTDYTSHKWLSVLTLADLGGLIAGLGAAFLLTNLVAWLPGFFTYVGLGAAGVWLAREQDGQRHYQRLGLWCSFQVRRALAPTTLTIQARQFWTRRVAGPQAFDLDGVVSFQP